MKFIHKKHLVLKEGRHIWGFCVQLSSPHREPRLSVLPWGGRPRAPAGICRGGIIIRVRGCAARFCKDGEIHRFSAIFCISLKSTKIDQSLQSSFSGTRGDIPDLFFPTIRARSTLFRKVGVGSYRSEISDFSAKRTLCSGGQKSLVRTYGRLSK